MPLKIVLYTRERFSSRDKARTLLELFHEHGGVLAPERYSEFEPIREPFDISDLTEPANLLAGYEKVPSGGLYLRGIDGGTVSWIRWSEGNRIMPWHIKVSDKALKKTSPGSDVINLLGVLFTHYDIVFGGVGSKAFWEGSDNRMGASIAVQPLPGIFPITVFGPDVIEVIGRNRIASLEVEGLLEWGDSLGLLLTENLKAKYEVLSDKIDQIKKTLGEDLFYDINDPQKPYRSISALVEEPPIEAAEEITAKESFTYNVIKTPEGEDVSSPQELVGVLMTYLYDGVPELTQSNRDSLKALDGYFTRHPPKIEFNNKFLLDAFIPALGAHLGGVLIESLSGEWEHGSRLLNSTVKIGDKAFPVFEMAYEAVYEGKKLTDSFDACIAQT